MVDLVEGILQYVAEHGACDSLQLARVMDVDHQKVVGTIKSIQAFGNVFLPVVSTAASASTTQTKINAITLPYQQLTHDQEPHVLNLSTPHDGASTASTMAIKGRLQQHPRSGHVGWHRSGVMSNPFLFFVQVFLPVVSTAASASTTQTKINAITLPYQQLTHDQEPHVLNLSTPHDGASTASTMAIKGRLQQHPRSGHVGWHRSGVMSNPFLFFVQVLQVEQQSGEHWELTAEGSEVCQQGSPEGRLVRRLGPEGLPRASLSRGDQLGLSKALALGWVLLDKEHGTVRLSCTEPPPDLVQASLCQVRSGHAHLLDDAQRQELKRRKLLRQVVVKSYRVQRGENFATQLSKPETDLTAEMLASGQWRQRPFKAYNFAALGQPTEGGHLHPLLQVRSEVRQVFLEMGFTEMSTARYVENAFWNFDALFQPQQHPARDAHDTFFLKEPRECQRLPEPSYVEAVKLVHSVGGHGSQGYQSPWLESEARKNLLRTHTTAVSARMLYALAQRQPFTPCKLFSIDRVFRNETLDATHLAEFCQVEGLVADRGLTLGHLQALIGGFFAQLGMERVRFKPAYNPYTEPSMEIFAFHPGLDRWVEVGNSGLFRPEMLQPMGLPQDVRCIAWGLSLERPTMIKCGLNNIRDLVGPRVDLDMVYSSPLCRFVH